MVVCVHKRAYVCMCACVCLGRVGVQGRRGQEELCRDKEKHGGSGGRYEECWLPSLKEEWQEKCENLVGSKKQAL